MKDREKKQLGAVAIAAALLYAWRRGLVGKATDADGFEQTFTPENHGAAIESAIDRLAIARIRAQQLMGADPNTRASKNPDAAGRKFVEETLALARDLSVKTNGSVGLPTEEEARYELSKKLPGDELAKVNAELYAILGVDPSGDNTPTKTLTPASEQRARSLIAKWRPYSQEAVTLLFYLLDDARALGEA
jgi:hypothetical protein